MIEKKIHEKKAFGGKVNAEGRNEHMIKEHSKIEGSMCKQQGQDTIKVKFRH